MTETIIEYIKKYGEYTFAEKPLNDVDSLALCQLSYLKFDGMVPGMMDHKGPVLLKNLPQHQSFQALFADERYEKQNRALFDAMLHSRRFKNLRINNYISILENGWETQFSAVTFLPAGEQVFVAFRGTDESIVGWKEDFNMAFQNPIPGQAYAVKYLNLISERIPGGFYIGGHSKGGNLAVYAALHAKKEIRDRIRKVYSMDGPGFRKEVLANAYVEELQDRIVKILPESSVIGMLFETSPKYKVVASKTIGILQHDPYTWVIQDDDFFYVEDVDDSHKFADHAFTEWVESLKPEERKLFVDTLYQVVSASEAENLIDLSADWKRSFNGMVSAIKELDEETKKMLKTVTKELFDIFRVHLKNKFQDKRE